MDPQLQRFYRQYLQQFSHLRFPPGDLLKEEDVQQSLETYFFNDENVANIPSAYQRRGLDRIIQLIETAVKDPEEEGVSDLLYSRRAALAQTSKKPILEKSVVVYHPPVNLDSSVQPILIREAKNIIGSGPNVGLRTWEASLRLAHYIHSNPDIIQNRNILELGAGTGFLSIFCSAILKAKSVIATDGIEQILDSLRENIQLNNHFFQNNESPRPLVRKLAWEDEDNLVTAFKDDSGNDIQPDIILGADITYHPDACESLAQLLGKLMKRWTPRNPGSTGPQIYISAVERAPKTITDFFANLRQEIGTECTIEEIEFNCPVDRQKGLFHSVAMPIRIFRISRGHAGAGGWRIEERLLERIEE